MHLFEFELKPIGEITPWGDPPNQSLSWFALSYGVFRINVGSDTLFRYSNAMLSHWNETNSDVDYQIAAFARDFLETISPAVSSLPCFLQKHTEDWILLQDIVNRSREHEARHAAFRWLEERSPCTAYLLSPPRVSFIRRGDDILIGWNNGDCLIDGIPAWESEIGTFVLSVDDFLNECRSFSNRLLDAMFMRIEMIDSHRATAQIPLDTKNLLEQHDSWRNELDGYFEKKKVPDISWEQTQVALDIILAEFTT